MASDQRRAEPARRPKPNRIKLSRELMLRLARALASRSAQQAANTEVGRQAPHAAVATQAAAAPERFLRGSSAHLAEFYGDPLLVGPVSERALALAYDDTNTIMIPCERSGTTRQASLSQPASMSARVDELRATSLPANSHSQQARLAEEAHWNRKGPAQKLERVRQEPCSGQSTSPARGPRSRLRKWRARPRQLDAGPEGADLLAQQAHFVDICLIKFYLQPTAALTTSKTTKEPTITSATAVTTSPTYLQVRQLAHKGAIRGHNVAQAGLSGARADSRQPSAPTATEYARVPDLPLNINDHNDASNFNLTQSNNLNNEFQIITELSKCGSSGSISILNSKGASWRGHDLYKGDGGRQGPRQASRASLSNKVSTAKSNTNINLNHNRNCKQLKFAKHEPSVIPTRPRHALPALLLALLLVLALPLWPRPLAPRGAGLARATPQAAQAPPSQSEELSRAVLATMSTQAPPAELNVSALADLSPAPAPAPELPPGPLDRLLEFCRIFIMGAIIVGDICGNSLVILSVCRHSKLRVTTNWFVVSLACADILVALFAMTFNASVIIWGRWLFQRWVCDFWNSCDVLASTASILHLCCISIDRYIAITRPLDYPMKITTRRVMYALCAVWISSALLSYIPIFTGIYTTEDHQQWLKSHPDQCEFSVNRVYAVVSSSVSFWIPCCIMVFTYYRIYREASRQEKFIYKAQNMIPAPMPNHHHHQSGANHHHGPRSKQRRSKSVAVGSTNALKQLASKQAVATTRLDRAPQRAPAGPQPASSLNKLEQESAGRPECEPLTEAGASPKAPASVVTFSSGAPAEVEPEELDEVDSNSGQSTPTKRSISKMKREHKAAKTLGIIMGVFILCWLPFFSWYTPQHICGKACDGMVPKEAVTILFWIGYFNSTLNPIIYAYFNHEFRDAFKKTLQWIFCCCQDLKCLRVNRPNDNQHYNCTYRSTQEIGLVSNG